MTKIIELQRKSRSFNNFNIFGTDITLYKPGYVASKGMFTFNGQSSGYLTWELDENKKGVFDLKWLDMTVEEIMLSELKARRDSRQLEIESMQLEIEMIDKELAKYEKK